MWPVEGIQILNFSTPASSGTKPGPTYLTIASVNDWDLSLLEYGLFQSDKKQDQLTFHCVEFY